MFAIMNVKYLTALLVLLMAVDASLATPEKDTSVEDKKVQEYLKKLENVDVDKILSSNRLVKNYINCFLDEGPCTPQQQDIKKMIPALLENNCKLCSKTQKDLVKNAITKMQRLRHDDYEKLVKTYDPKGIYQKKFLESLDA